MHSPQDVLRPRHIGSTPFQFSLLLPILLLVVVAFVTTPHYHSWHKPVDLPFVPHAPRAPDGERDVAISVQSDGHVFIDTMWYPDAKFHAKLQELGSRSRDKRFVIAAARSLSFSRRRFVLRSLRDAGYRDVLLLTFQGRPVQLLGKPAA